VTAVDGAPVVVVASFRAQHLLHACLHSLLPQCAASGAQVIVARDERCGDLAAIAAAYPSLVVVSAPAGASVPVLRGVGLSSATTRGVAVLVEDHCVAAADWLVTLLREMEDASVAGGGMANAQTARAIDWGAYFSEYGFFDATRREGDSRIPLLTGANVAYADAVRDDVTRWMRAGAWENTVHLRLAAEGHRFRFVPGAVIAQNLRYGFAAFCDDRFVHGRDFARTRLRLARTGGARRIAMALLAPCLPALLTVRLWRMAAGRTESRRRAFVRALPFTVAFLAAWSIGEAVGYGLGPDDA